MVRLRKHILFVAAVLCFSISVPARELPRLSAEKNIRTGTLENGIQYYLAAVPEKKGFADIALVRKGEVPSSQTAAQMKGVEKFAGTSPERFLIRNGIGAGGRGYFEDRDGSTVFRFQDVPMYDTAVADSTLLLTFALIAESPAPQALFIAGDITPDEILRKMGLFSMLVPYQRREAVEEEYVWEPYISPSFTFSKLEGTDEASVSVTYFAPRTPRRYMDTAQPLIMDIFAKEFELIVKRRLSERLQAKGIPYSSIEVDYLRSAETSGDVKYTIVIDTDKDHVDAAMEEISRNVASLAEFGVGKDDFVDARGRLSPYFRTRARTRPSNRSYLDRCIHSWLYGSSLASRSEEYRIFSRRPSLDSSGLGFFNRMAASFLNPSCNADILYEAPLDSLDDLDAFFRYNLTYLEGSTIAPRSPAESPRGDTLSLVGKGPRVKVRKEAVDPVTGGALWTLSNGFRVIYNQVKDTEEMHYAFVLPEGYAAANPASGEGGFYSDLLEMYLPMEMLLANGVDLKVEVDVSNTVLSGTVRPSRLPLLLRSVLMTLREPEEPGSDRLKTYYIGERLRLASRRMQSYRMKGQLYGALHPEYALTPFKDSEAIGDDLGKKADKFFRERLFPGASKGFLVLCGESDPLEVRKVLLTYLGHIRPSPSVQARPARYVFADGRKSLGTPSVPGKVFLRAECPFALTGKTRYMTGAVAETVRRAVVRTAGLRVRDVRVECRFDTWPEEHLVLEISYMLVSGEPGEVFEAILSALSSGNVLNNKDAVAFRAMELAAAEASFKTPEGVNALALARYALNKDFKTRYEQNIRSITREDIAGAVASLAAGSWASNIAKWERKNSVRSSR